MDVEEIIIGFFSGIVGSVIIIILDYLASNSRKKVKEIIKCVRELREEVDARKFIRNKYRYSLGVTLDRFIKHESPKIPMIINKPKSVNDQSDRYDFYNEHIVPATEQILTFHSAFVRLIFWKYYSILKFVNNLKRIVEQFDNVRQYEIDNRTNLLTYSDEYFEIVKGKENNRFVKDLLIQISKNKKLLNRI